MIQHLAKDLLRGIRKKMAQNNVSEMKNIPELFLELWVDKIGDKAMKTWGLLTLKFFTLPVPSAESKQQWNLLGHSMCIKVGHFIAVIFQIITLVVETTSWHIIML